MKKTINFLQTVKCIVGKREIKDIDVDQFVTNDHQKISWSSNVKQDLRREKTYKYDEKYLRTSLYRPFSKQHIYFSSELNSRQGKTPKVFPLEGGDNLAICISMDRNNWLPLMCDVLPDFQLSRNTKIFPRYSYDNGEKIDNINPRVERQFQEHYKDKKIDADALFYFIYGLLHSKEYREKYKNNLRLDTPRIPLCERLLAV